MNIDISENIKKIQIQMTELRSELLRLEGSMRTLQNMKDMGINKIDIKNEDIMDSKEVVDGDIQG
jgi:lipid II:glycine glycyltransferase (peptidoglycan interpeptide bridge formation enzyme)